MKVKAIAPWFGSKRSMAPEIAIELGRHAMFIDPMCGSMAVLFAKDVTSHETVNDLHGHLINLARTIQRDDSRADLLDRLRWTLYSSDLFEQSRCYIETHPLRLAPDEPDVAAAYHYFVVSWMGRNGTAGTERLNYQKATRWTPGGGGGPKRFANTVETVPAWAQRLRNVDILQMDAFDLLGRVSDQQGVAIYCDPPYTRDTRGAASYEHDFQDGGDGMFANADDHARLAACLGNFQKARVVVSYYDSPRIRELYSGWTFRQMTRQKNLHVQNRRGAGKCEAPEILLINGPSYVTESTPEPVAAKEAPA